MQVVQLVPSTELLESLARLMPAFQSTPARPRPAIDVVHAYHRAGASRRRVYQAQRGLLRTYGAQQGPPRRRVAASNHAKRSHTATLLWTDVLTLRAQWGANPLSLRAYARQWRDTFARQRITVSVQAIVDALRGETWVQP